MKDRGGGFEVSGLWPQGAPNPKSETLSLASNYHLLEPKYTLLRTTSPQLKGTWGGGGLVNPEPQTMAAVACNPESLQKRTAPNPYLVWGLGHACMQILLSRFQILDEQGFDLGFVGSGLAGAI